MRKFSRFSVALLASSVLMSTTVQATNAGFSLPFGDYSVFVRSNGVTEIRINGSIADRTSATLNCAVGSSRDILAMGNQTNPAASSPAYNDAALATVLTAYATKSTLEVLISDTDKDANDNCVFNWSTCAATIAPVAFDRDLANP